MESNSFENSCVDKAHSYLMDIRAQLIINFLSFPKTYEGVLLDL